jgi:hypothetical protein
MGLDIYAGPLCRYYSGNWQTTLQQVAAQGGMPVHVIRPSHSSGLWEKIASAFRPKPDQVAAVRNWRGRLAADSPWIPAEDWDWPEAPDLAYQTDKPDWIGYGAVQLWAAYTECQGETRPEAPSDDWTSDPVFQRVGDSSAEFSHTIGPELWLPLRFDRPFEAVEPSGNTCKIGSLPALFAELQKLNDLTWKATADQIRQWRMNDWDPEGAESTARWGFSIWYCLTEFAVTARAPMRLDY